MYVCPVYTMQPTVQPFMQSFLPPVVIMQCIEVAVGNEIGTLLLVT